MTQEDDRRLFIESVDSILQIRREELKNDKETALFFNSRYREVGMNFTNKIFGSAAAVATLLTAILTAIIGFGGPDQYVLIVSIALGIVIVFVIVTECLFSVHLRESATKWFELDQKYASAINHINRQRIFLASRIDIINKEHFHALIPYTAVTLGLYRKDLVDQIEIVCDIISIPIIGLDYVKDTLVHLANRQKEYLTDAYNSYESRREEFETEAQFLLDLPLVTQPTQEWKFSSESINHKCH